MMLITEQRKNNMCRAVTRLISRVVWWDYGRRERVKIDNWNTVDADPSQVSEASGYESARTRRQGRRYGRGERDTVALEGLR